MTKFMVSIEHIETYYIIVEADSGEEAIEKVEDIDVSEYYYNSDLSTGNMFVEAVDKDDIPQNARIVR